MDELDGHGTLQGRFERTPESFPDQAKQTSATFLAAVQIGPQGAGLGSSEIIQKTGQASRKCVIQTGLDPFDIILKGLFHSYSPV
jgi:hypothetical protein